MQEREEKLLDAFLNGSETAFEELVRENRDKLYRVAMRILRNHDDALDVIQDSLVKAYRQASGFRRESGFSTWLLSIVVREAINRAKRDRFRNVLSLDTLAGMSARSSTHSSGDPAGTASHSSASPDERAEAAILAERIRKAVESLPPVQRAVFAMRHYEGLKISEIAELTGSSEGTVKANYFHAVRKLRVKLSPFLGKR